MNWKAPGPDGVHGYWIKMLVSMQERIALHLQSCITRGEVPDWMTTGRNVLLLKDKRKGNEVSNYWLITCLPLLWKLITGIVADEIYNHLEENDLLPKEQKSCRRDSRGTKDQLLIDKAVMKNCRRRKVGLSMVWIDYWKAYDMVPHSWIKKIIHLLFMDDLKLYGNSGKEAEKLTNTVRIFSKDIAMEFGISKCSPVPMKGGKLVSVGGTELSSGEVIPELEPDKCYKYLRILKADDIKHTEMKDKIKKEYYWRVRQLTSSKLNDKNRIRALNSRAVSLVKHSVGILKWTKDELKAMDRNTRKIMTMNRMYQPQSDTGRLYILRMDGG